MSFRSLGLSPLFLPLLVEQKYTKPYPIQEQAIPAILKGKDVLAIAQTGAGKTASYVLPVLNNLDEKKKLKNRHIDVLVMVPTRELAVQVDTVFKTFGKAVPFQIKSLAIHGGVSINPQMQAIQHVNILVATPGRLLELVDSNAVHLSSISTLILDEADKMLSLGFKEEMNRVFDQLPAKRQNLLFSATLSPEVLNIKELLLNAPQLINIVPETNQVELIEQIAYSLPKEKKGPFLRYLIKHNKMKQVMIFTSSVYQADLVADKLNKNGVKARAIHSKKSQSNRTESLNRFKSGRTPVLVTTDLLARGIDIEFLPYVINYELPRSPKDFIHRIGRTGRAENPGKAISLITEEEEHHFKVIQKKMKKQIALTDTEDINLQGF